MRRPDVTFACDSPGCKGIASLTPRVYVPSKHGQHYTALTLSFPKAHWCQLHWDTQMRLSLLLDDKAKARFEDLARKVWPQDGKPDFDAALIEPVSLYSREYGDYMLRLGFSIDGLGYSIHNKPKRQLSAMAGWI